MTNFITTEMAKIARAFSGALDIIEMQPLAEHNYLKWFYFKWFLSISPIQLILRKTIPKEAVMSLDDKESPCLILFSIGHTLPIYH